MSSFQKKTLHFLDLLLRCWEKSSKHSIPNGSLMLIYHGTIRKKITNETNPRSSQGDRFSPAHLLRVETPRGPLHRVTRWWRSSSDDDLRSNLYQARVKGEGWRMTNLTWRWRSWESIWGPPPMPLVSLNKAFFFGGGKVAFGEGVPLDSHDKV